MRKVIKINEKLTVTINDNMVSILDDTTFIPLSVHDLRLIAENLGLNEEEEPPKRATTKKSTPKKSEPKVEPKTETQSDNNKKSEKEETTEVETTEVVEEFQEVPPKNPFI